MKKDKMRHEMVIISVWRKNKKEEEEVIVKKNK